MSFNRQQRRFHKIPPTSLVSASRIKEEELMSKDKEAMSWLQHLTVNIRVFIDNVIRYFRGW
jgi:hypothetical protein